MKDELHNKVVVITGGNSGIGYATAQKVISEGGYPIVVGKDQEKIEKAVKTLGKQAIGYIANIAKLSELENLYRKIEREFDVIHGVVVNAGIAVLELCENITEESFDDTLNVNLKGALFTAQKAVSLMKNGGSIVFVSSAAARRTFSGASMYSLTKTALCSLASTMALELAAKNIRVNSVSPGTIVTPIFEKLGLTPEQFQVSIENHEAKIPLGRCGEPREVANVIAFLLSEESSYVTGSDILVDGGLSNCNK